MTVDVSTIYLLDVAARSALKPSCGMPSIKRSSMTGKHWRPALVTVLHRTCSSGRVIPFPMAAKLALELENKMARVQGLLAFRGFSRRCPGRHSGPHAESTYKDGARVEPGGQAARLYRVPRGGALEPARAWGHTCACAASGTALLTAAVELSEAEGFKGRIGLHSLPQADDVLPQMRHDGSRTRPTSNQDLRYFEMTAEQAVRSSTRSETMKFERSKDWWMARARREGDLAVGVAVCVRPGARREPRCAPGLDR